MNIDKLHNNIYPIESETLERIGDHYTGKFPVLCFNEKTLEIRKSSSETRKTNTQAYIVLSPEEKDSLKIKSSLIFWIILILFAPIALGCLFLSAFQTILLIPSILSFIIMFGTTRYFDKKDNEKRSQAWDKIINNRIINYSK